VSEAGQSPSSRRLEAERFDWEALSRPMEGRIVRLEPLSGDHAEGLWEASADQRVWEITNEVIDSRERFDAWLGQALDEQKRHLAAPFATLDAATGRALGSTRYGTLRPEHRSLEIGWTWLASTAWGTGANVEAKLMMLTRAFEDLGCIRVEFKTNARNVRSRGALEALGAQFEGVHRSHMLVRDGERRDSAWYSVLDDEWPAVKANLERRLRAVTR
jgi:RimJ/RimL family protein N-acetyltransferase